ncbi:hypothetical protein QUB30_10710 [Microcoleus sp. BROC3]
MLNQTLNYSFGVNRAGHRTGDFGLPKPGEALLEQQFSTVKM